MKGGSRRQLADLLRQLAKQVEVLSEADLRGIAEGDFELVLEVRVRKPQKRPSETRTAESSFEEIIGELDSLQSREAGVRLLEERELTKKDLELLARKVDLPVLKSDSVARLRDKIVEATIGYRLRSEAVHGRGPDRKGK